MGLFDLFKKKPSDNKPQAAPVDHNEYLLETLRNKLNEAGYAAERHPHYHALIVNGDIEIATFILDDPGMHPNLLHLLILTIHPEYFRDGIKENIVGLGTNIEEKVNSVIDNYINTTFLPIIDSFTDSHDPALDFTTVVDGKEILCHPKLGNLTFHGQWNDKPANEPLFELIKDKLKNKLTSNKLNWLKMYISKRSDGTIIGECLFNNEPWEEGLADITEYARSWEMKSDFQGLKQFIMFRRCDASE